MATTRRVRLVARTEFVAPPDVAWDTDADGGQALAEFAGRACYQSWDKPKPATATNAGFLAHLLEVGHLSVLEHATATFYLTGVSRAAVHELARHRHLSISQLSPRVQPSDSAPVVPPGVLGDPELEALFDRATTAAHAAHDELLAALEARTAGAPGATLRRRQARQAARAVLPLATEARAVVTGNYRAWRHVVGMRATDHADVELRELAVDVLLALQDAAPHVFADFDVATLPDGTRIASSPYVTDS
ncbi:FAD-dependent thymidylate synthase [Rhodococcus aerolatus]